MSRPSWLSANALGIGMRDGRTGCWVEFELACIACCTQLMLLAVDAEVWTLYRCYWPASVPLSFQIVPEARRHACGGTAQFPLALLHAGKSWVERRISGAGRAAVSDDGCTCQLEQRPRCYCDIARDDRRCLSWSKWFCSKCCRDTWLDDVTGVSVRSCWPLTLYLLLCLSLSLSLCLRHCVSLCLWISVIDDWVVYAMWYVAVR